MNELVESLIVSSMRHNYAEFVRLYGYDLANEKLQKLFGETWTKHKEDIWVWYDEDEIHETFIVDFVEQTEVK